MSIVAIAAALAMCTTGCAKKADISEDRMNELISEGIERFELEGRVDNISIVPERHFSLKTNTLRKYADGVAFLFVNNTTRINISEDQIQYEREFIETLDHELMHIYYWINVEEVGGHPLPWQRMCKKIALYKESCKP